MNIITEIAVAIIVGVFILYLIPLFRLKAFSTKLCNETDPTSIDKNNKLLHEINHDYDSKWMNAADVDFVITHPEGYELDPRFCGNATVEYNQMKALEGADFVYAKNWSCPGVTLPEKYGQILSKDMSWTIDEKHMAVTNNAYFLHCLPVRRNMIVSDAVIDSPRSLVIPEAANRVVSAQVVMKRMLESLNG